jgi:hypothetical protein
MVDNLQRIKNAISEKPMTVHDLSKEFSISHRQAKKLLHSIPGLKFATHDNRKYYSLSEERLEKAVIVKKQKEKHRTSRSGNTLPFLLDYLPFDKKAVIAYLIIMVAISLYLKSYIGAIPIGDERLYAAAGVQAVNGKIFIYEHPPISYYLFGLSTPFIPLDYGPVLELPGNWYYGLSHPVIVGVISQALPAMRIIPIIISFLLAGVMFYYSKRLYGVRAALLVFFMASLSINILLYSSVLMMEIVMLFFGTTTILFYVLDYMPTRTQKNGLILFILLTLTLGTRALQPFIILAIILISEALRIMKRKEIDPVIWIAIGASVIAFFFYYPYENFSLSLQQFTAVSRFGQNMLVPLLSKITLLVMLFVPIALFKYFSHIGSGKKVKSTYHVLFLAAIVTGAYSLFVGNFRYATIALPFMFFIIPYAFKHSGAPLKNVALLLAAVALVSSITYFPYFDNYNNLVAKTVGVTHIESRANYVHSFSVLEQNYNGEKVWTDSSILLYSGITMTGFYDYDVAKDMNGRIISEGTYHAQCADKPTIQQHISEMGYGMFVETDPAKVSDACPGLRQLLTDTQPLHSDDIVKIYRF